MHVPDSLDQYKIETTWSTRIEESIIMDSIKNDVPLEMETAILNKIAELNNNTHIENSEIYIALFVLLLKDPKGKPKTLQAIATKLGMSAGMSDPFKAFTWGVLFLKECQDFGLYSLYCTRDINEEPTNSWYIHCNFILDRKTYQKLSKLQYLPPMKKPPLPWKDNHMGGWLWENKHIILGHRYNRHDDPLAYDALNKLQTIPWEIDTDTYLFEKQTNTTIKKQQFNRVINEYLGKHFYFVWRYDSRGRSYSSGYDLNLQNNEYGKALVSLHQKETIDKQNIGNLYIAIANHAGKDKLTWSERMDWASKQPNFDDIEWDEPILGRKAIRALKASQEGKPTGYVMSLDATSSGLQLMAVLSGCRETAKWVNCIDPNKRYDLYTEVANMMNSKLPKDKCVKRKIIKESTMTHYYNSKATPKSLLSKEQLEVFYEVLDGLLPGAEVVMETINNCWNYEKDHHSWIMPDGHKVYVPIITGTNVIYSDPELGEIPLRFHEQTLSNDFKSLCPNVIHSVDGYVAREMIRRCDFQLSHVHDCFVFHPNYLQRVCKTYREIMADIAKSNLFEDILQQLMNDTSIKVSKDTNDLDTYILNSEYMLS